MLAYQHAYHAGNFADVHKHLVLFAVTRHLLRKKSPITYIDTHAGRGLYPLDARETRRLKEYRQGVAPLWQARETLAKQSELMAEWLACLGEAQAPSEAASMPKARLSHYPGSPWWLARRLRPQDRLSLFELHPGEHRSLAGQSLPGNARRLHGDGLKGLTGMLPVSTPRLCVLIDPSYELKDDYTEVAEVLLEAARKARHALVLVWYPLLPASRHERLLERVRDGGLRKLWHSELRLHTAEGDDHGMYGSGMLVLNPPWGLDEAVADAMEAILPLLGASARHDAGWWVGE